MPIDPVVPEMPADEPVVLVTGASHGIGAELALQYAAAGANVALAARDSTRLAQVADACRARGARALVVITDVTDQASCRAMVNDTVAHFGRIDTLINNAGVGASGRFDEITDLTIFETLMRVNYLGSVWCTAFALPHLKQTKGRLVAISSLTGLTGVPKRTAYAATKHAMAGFFDSLRIELAESDVSVTVAYPGFVLTEINQHALAPDGRPFGDRGFRRTTSESMTVEECARIILRAVARRDRDVVMTWRGKVGRLLKLVAPSLVDVIARKAIEERQ